MTLARGWIRAGDRAIVALLAVVIDDILAGKAIDLALTTVSELRDDDAVRELVRMLGSDDVDGPTRKHAEEPLRAA